MKHSGNAKIFLKNVDRAEWHDKALWLVREKRDIEKDRIAEWEQLRNLASEIKEHTLSYLDKYLIRFEQQATKNGITIHWAEDAHAHNKIVLDILENAGIKKLVKSKSMLTEECRLNIFLERNGLEVIDTDLGERIVQLADEPPSHIVMPAIHKKKSDISALFHEKLGTDPNNDDPTYLTRAARQHLRKHFFSDKAALTGVNFAIAETGGFVVCTNEGNADMGTHLADIHIASMGMEKIIPEKEHLGVFLRLLARSATGQPITVYTSHYHSPGANRQLHLIIVDNGRSDILGRSVFSSSLKCIRCGACMNTCPVYRRSGGYSYRSVIPGPIGSILSPHINLEQFGDLPFASSLCGSCSDVCPVKINIHEQLYAWRQIFYKEGKFGFFKSTLLRSSSNILSHPGLYRLTGKIMRTFLSYLPKKLIYNSINVWGKSREMPTVPKQSFNEWYRQNRLSK